MFGSFSPWDSSDNASDQKVFTAWFVVARDRQKSRIIGSFEDQPLLKSFAIVMVGHHSKSPEVAFAAKGAAASITKLINKKYDKK